MDREPDDRREAAAQAVKESGLPLGRCGCDDCMYGVADAVLAALPSEGWEQVIACWENVDTRTHDAIYYAVENVMRRRVDGAAPQTSYRDALDQIAHSPIASSSSDAVKLRQIARDALDGAAPPEPPMSEKGQAFYDAIHGERDDVLLAPASSTPTEVERLDAALHQRIGLPPCKHGCVHRFEDTTWTLLGLANVIGRALSGQQDTTTERKCAIPGCNWPNADGPDCVPVRSTTEGDAT